MNISKGSGKINGEKRKKIRRRKKKESASGLKRMREKRKDKHSLRNGEEGVGTGKVKINLFPVDMALGFLKSVPASTSIEMSSDSSEAELEVHPTTSSGGRRRQLPARFREDGDSDGNDGVVCDIFNYNEPEGLSSSTIFWIDCNKCGSWVHNVCAFGSNTVTRQYLCLSCKN